MIAFGHFMVQDYNLTFLELASFPWSDSSFHENFTGFPNKN